MRDDVHYRHYRERAIALLKLGQTEASLVAALVAEGAPQADAEALTRELAPLRVKALGEARADAPPRPFEPPPESEPLAEEPGGAATRWGLWAVLAIVGSIVVVGAYSVVSKQRQPKSEWGGYGSPAVEFAVEESMREPSAAPAETLTNDDALARCSEMEGWRMCVMFALTPHTKAMLEKEHAESADVGVALSGDPTTEAVRALGQVPWLRQFSTIGGENITDASAFASLPELRRLKVMGAGFPTLEPLGALTKLRALTLYGPTGLRDTDLSALATLRELESISITGPGPELEDVSVIAELPALRSAGLSNLPSSALAALKRAVALRELYLEDPIVDGANDLAALGELAQLEELSITDESGVADFAFFSKLTALKRASVASSALKSVAPFAALPLEKLNLRKTAVRDVSPVAKMKALRRFNVPADADPKSVAALRKARPDLEIVESDL